MYTMRCGTYDYHQEISEYYIINSINSIIHVNNKVINPLISSLIVSGKVE